MLTHLLTMVLTTCLSDSVVLELVVLCLQYDTIGEAEADAADPIEIDVVEVIAAGTFAALFCIPGMLVFAAAFHPQAPLLTTYLPGTY